MTIQVRFSFMLKVACKARKRAVGILLTQQRGKAYLRTIDGFKYVCVALFSFSSNCTVSIKCSINTLALMKAIITSCPTPRTVKSGCTLGSNSALNSLVSKHTNNTKPYLLNYNNFLKSILNRSQGPANHLVSQGNLINKGKRHTRYVYCHAFTKFALLLFKATKYEILKWKYFYLVLPIHIQEPA